MRKTCGGDLLETTMVCDPVCYTGLQNEKGLIVFDDDFEQSTITKLIYDIENMRQSGSYDALTLYFSSHGGDIKSMYMLANYLNKIEFDIDLIVNGAVESAGFYILLLIDNPCIEVSFNDYCSGMIHLGDTFISARGQLEKTSPSQSYYKFHKSEIDRINDEFKEIIAELDLTDKEKKHIFQGKDLFLSKDRLEHIYEDYMNKKYYTSDEAFETYICLKTKYQQLENSLKDMEKGFDFYANIDIKKELEVE